jgi:hypothetical protein
MANMLLRCWRRWQLCLQLLPQQLRRRPSRKPRALLESLGPCTSLPPLPLPVSQVRAHVEQQIMLVAKGQADKGAVVAHTLEQFKAKFAFFVAKIARMDGCACTPVPRRLCCRCSGLARWPGLAWPRLASPRADTDADAALVAWLRAGCSRRTSARWPPAASR